MKINFDEIKKQNYNSETLLNIMEVMYNKMNSIEPSGIIFNEFVNGMEQSTANATFSFSLKHNPISYADVFIVLEDGSLVITPISIIKIEKNVVTLKNSQLKKNMNLFVTYKY